MSKLGLGKQMEAGAAAPALFETCSCICRIAGDVRNEVPLVGISAPELVLLRAIHGGSETVVEVERDGELRNNGPAERMRLMSKYPRHGELFGELFGKGLSPQLPKTIAEAEELAAMQMEQAESDATSPTDQQKPEPHPLEEAS